jgi:hypothetical protein
VSVVVGRCGCHQWHPVTDVGGWLVRPGVGDLILVRDWAQSGIWRDRRCQLSRAELTSRIRAAGGISCDHALIARTLRTGDIELVDGLHRWTVAAELSIGLVPVEMSVEEAESPFAW